MVGETAEVDCGNPNPSALELSGATTSARTSPPTQKSTASEDLQGFRDEDLNNDTTDIDSDTVVDKLECVQQNYMRQGISKNVAKFMLGAWRSGTQKQYNCYIMKWIQYCNSKNINYRDPSIGQVLDNLYQCFRRGLAYSTLNTIQSSLSKIIKFDNLPVGQNEYVILLMKSFYQHRPNLPRYNCTWDINKVLKYIMSLGPNLRLSNDLLVKKLLALMAVLSGVRGQSLCLLDRYGPSPLQSKYVIG